MIINAEFQRNVWLELTPHRLIAMPAVLLAIFMMTYLFSERAFEQPLSNVALILYLLLTLLWGTRLAGEAVINEVKDNTWDQQRMSSISPWEMTWGKLLGSAIYTWYGAFICLVAYVISNHELEVMSIAKNVLLLLSAGLFSHAVALLSSLQTTRAKRSYNRSASTTFMVLGIIVAVPFINLGLDGRGGISWYGMRFETVDFFLTTVLCFCAWALVGIYRRIREELQFRNTPVIWFIFCVFMLVFISGLVTKRDASADELMTIRLFVAYSTCVSLAYVMIFLEDKDPLMIRRYMVAAKLKNWQALWENTPCWFLNLGFVLVLSSLLAFMNYPIIEFISRSINFKTYLIAMAIFLFRDVMLFVLFNLSPNRQRADMTAIFYLLVLYVLLPGLLGGAFNVPLIKELLLPIGSSSPITTIVSGAVQLTVLVYLAVLRWRKLNFGLAR